MVARSRVATDADVPIVRPTRPSHAGSGATGDYKTGSVSTGCARLRLRQVRKQCNQVLLAQGSGSEAAHLDVERAVLPEQVISEQWVRELRTLRLTWRAGYSRRGQRRNQVRGIWHRHQPCGQRVGLKDLAVGACRIHSRVGG